MINIVVKCFLKIAFWAIVGWMAVELLIMHYYQDVTECFTATAEVGVPRYITIHHDGIDRQTSLKEIDTYHKDSCGWECGFAYHYYISNDRIYKVRDEHQIGSHVKNGNSLNIGICVHGDFNKTRPTLKQQILILILINKLVYQYQIKKENIKRHQDWEQNPTSCCGQNFDFERMKTYIISK